MTLWQRFLRNWYALQEGEALRVIFYYQGEEPTYLDDAFVTVFRNGMVEVEHRNEHVTTHVQNVEVLWKNKAGQTSAPARPLTLVKGEATPHELRPN
jgi:hypothetical protein